MTPEFCPIEIQYWVLTSLSRITTPKVSVAEDYYKNKADQVLKGRVVKTPNLLGVTVGYCNTELQNTQQKEQNHLESYSDIIIL